MTERRADETNNAAATMNFKPASMILQADAVEALRELKQRGERFDLVIADPPYNIGKDFGNNRADMPIERYIEWARGWVDDCLQLLADDGLLYLYGFPEIVARIASGYPIERQRWLVWHYTNKAVPSSKFWQRSHETILCLWKPGRPRPRLEIDQIREPYTPAFMKNAGRERKDTPSRYGKTGRRTVYNAHQNGALPRDVLKTPALAGGAGRSERWFLCRDCGGKLYPPAELNAHREHDILKHPTQKPMALTKRLILSRIGADGGRLLVPFAGTGSECAAAEEMGVEFVGIELNPEYASFARQWVQHVRLNGSAVM